MRILYGVQATGAGHIARSRILLPELRKLNIEVDFLFSGGELGRLFDMAVFDDFKYRSGLTLSFVDGKIDKLKTLFNSKPVKFIGDIYREKLDSYDLIISDFEPITAWAAKLHKKPSLGLANQYSLIEKLPEFKISYLQRLGIKIFAPVDNYLGIHWRKLTAKTLPPLTEQWFSAEQLQNSSEDFILVYLPNENLKQFLAFATKFASEKFIVYTPEVSEAREYGNIKVAPLNRKIFLRDLIASQGVICNTGFALCTEAMQVGKKILTKPLTGQFEQNLNAQVLLSMQRADVMHSLDAQKMHTWLKKANPAPIEFPNTAQALALWIKSAGTLPLDDLINGLWHNYPLAS